MPQKLTIIFISCALLILAGKAWAIQDLIDSVTEGCKKELNSFCKEVTPGEGRVLACLYSHLDKLSGKCKFAIDDAATKIERKINAITYAASKCDDDMEKFCVSIIPGEGRILDCLEKHSRDVSERCKNAIKDAGLK